ncbi:MAG TPA: MBL fold metallo-hydrolase [Bryobacteraceae bacterium]|nr:MBL fold metallo-hydrolase [Bryobacteraceae bacterium]
MCAQPALERGALPEHWPSGGPNCLEMQEFYVHEYNPTFYVLRQSGCTDYEKPFLYLIFGSERAMLWDTGSRNSRVREAVDRLIDRWLKANKRESIPLLIVHSHRHGDHIAGDAQFAGRPDTTLIKPDLASVREVFRSGVLDLGGRAMDVIPIPGHTDDSIALYDRRTGILLTGDTVYPGRLYVSDFPAFRTSIHTLADFAASHPIAHVLGNHIEQTRTPFVDYPVGTKYQPDEHELAMSAGSIFELDRVVQSMDAPKKVFLRDMTIDPRIPNATPIKTRP